MILFLPLLIPIAGAFVILAFGTGRRAKPLALVVGGLEMLAILRVVWRIYRFGAIEAGHFLRADALSVFFLLNVAFISGLALVYSLDYLVHVPGDRFSSPRWFYGLLFLFVFTMAGVCLAANLGLLWIMIEATTLASALLVGFYNTKGAVEAGWKYLIVCTVGIAFALFGTIVLYLVAVKSGLPPSVALDWVPLMQAAHRFSGYPQLLKLAFIFVAVGYGTKIGFFPMHSWLPDAHAEAPSPISALLSAVLINCAMYALMRYNAVIGRAIGTGFTQNLLFAFGVSSMVFAGLLIVVQRDLKRLLAYSSIEHMGIIAIGVGLGGTLGLYGALLHVFNHSVGKSLLFFTAGNVRENFGTLRMDRIGGLGRSAPWTAAALVAGTVAIVGLPPFGLFVSEFAILSEAFKQSHFVVAGLFLTTLTVAFGGMLRHLFGMVFRERKPGGRPMRMVYSESLPIAVTIACLLLFGLHVPAGFTRLIHQAMAVL